MHRRVGMGFGNSGWLVVVCWFAAAFILWLDTAVVQARQPTTFPIPESIRPNVAFWKRIFTVLDSRSGLLHDTTNVELVYHTFQNLPAPSKQRQRLIDRYQRRYQKILLRLAQGKRRHLSRDEARVLALFKGRQTSKRLRAASRNIRFQLGLRDHFAKGLTRSGAYLPAIRRAFAAAGLPTELSLLPHVESSFNNQAYSKYGAAGMWQFTRGTGRRFLHIGRAIDQRLDFRRATAAAAKLLKENYQELGTWPLAITAYNHGVQGMKRAITNLGTQHFDTIIQRYRSRNFGFASKNFYAEFLAVLEIVKHLDTHFPDITFTNPQHYHTLKLDAYVSLRTIARYLKVGFQELARWNLALRGPILRGQRLIPKGYVLYLPKHRLSGTDIQQRWAKVPATEKFSRQLYNGKYRVRPGDTLSRIARRFGTSVEVLMDLNDIDRPDHIESGRLLRLPQPAQHQIVAHRPVTQAKPKAGKAERSSVPLTFVNHSAASSDNSHLDFYLVRAGFPLDQEWVPDTERWLQVREGVIRVVATESLEHYATWLEISVHRLRALNRLSHPYKLTVGAELRLDFSKVQEAVFTGRRLQYHRDIEEKFFRAYDVEGIITHTLKPGETLWLLAHDEYDVPLWLLQKYNHDLEFRTLTPGTKLRIPQVVEREAS